MLWKNMSENTAERVGKINFVNVTGEDGEIKYDELNAVSSAYACAIFGHEVWAEIARHEIACILEGLFSSNPLSTRSDFVKEITEKTLEKSAVAPNSCSEANKDLWNACTTREVEGVYLIIQAVFTELLKIERGPNE